MGLDTGIIRDHSLAHLLEIQTQENFHETRRH